MYCSYCCHCSSKIRKNSKYCWKCQANQSEIGPPDWNSRSASNEVDSPRCSSASDSHKKLSFGRPVPQDKPKPMTLEEYQQRKSKEQISGHAFRPKKKRKVGDNKDEMVTINIGMMKMVDDDLKPVWGKRLPVVVSKTSNYRSILEKAVEKYKAFNRKFDASKEHVLVYEDGSHAQLMPGKKDFFQLDNYKVEVGKDFKRIALYLCTLEELNISEDMLSQAKSPESPCSTPDTLFNNEDTYPHEMCDAYNRESYQLPTCDDEKVAWELQDQLDLEAFASPDPETTSEEAACIPIPEKAPKDPNDVAKKLQSKVDTNGFDNFFLVVRRGICLTRLFSLWQRQAQKTPVTRIFRVRIIGEDGIDSGAISKEFLETSIRDMEKVMFPDGFPVDSTLHVQNGNYHTCGEMAAVSIAQGGPPPCFLDEAAFNMMVNDVDIHNINDSDMSENEQQLIKEIESSCEEKVDTIIEHGYTGPINQHHIKAIVGSVKVFN